jgi:hypothetical protein
MVELADIHHRARRDLVVVTSQGVEDVFLWERSRRIADTAFKISQLPELAPRTADVLVVTITGLYQDAGWISQYHAGEICREQIGCKLTTPAQRELGAAFMERSLHDTVPADALHTASFAIRSLNDHDLDLYEAQLVAEATNLDAFGALGFWHLARKHTCEGRGVSAALETWQAQKQYGYWSARIKDSLRIPAVKRIAQERLDKFDCMIQQLAAHHQGDDITTAMSQSAGNRPHVHRASAEAAE